MTNTKLKNSQPAGETRELLQAVHPTHKQKLTNYMIGFALGLSAVAIAILMYWSFTGKDVLQIKNSPVPVKPVVTKSQEMIHLTIDYCKTSNTTGIVYRRLVSDKTELVAPTDVDNSPAGCHVLVIDVPIPPQTPVDTYHVNYRIDYKTNPLTTIREEFNSQEFKVVE